MKLISKLEKTVLYMIFIILVFFIITTRIITYKIIKCKDYTNLALELWTRTAPSNSSRGDIVDRNGELIVTSYGTPSVVVIPKQIDDKEIVADILAKETGVNKDRILKHLTKNVSVEILKPELVTISMEQAQKIMSYNLRGVYITPSTSRFYPHGNVLAQVLGIVGSDNIGLTGIENIYNEYLQGSSGGYLIYTDAHGNYLDNYTSYVKDCKKGATVMLTVDLRLQLVLENTIQNIVTRYNPKDVILVAMNPKNSEILGMASYPTFSLENYQDEPLEVINRNLPIWKCYEPGSVQKIITYAAGLEEGVFSLDEPFYDSGYLVVDGVRIRDWKAGGHGEENFLQVIENSCNPGFMTIGLRLGKERLFKYIRNFGLGKKTGIDLLGESTGILFDENKIGNVELATSSFGQGNSCTAIQLINAASAAVNGGTLYEPRILKKIYDNEKILVEPSPVKIREVISKETSNKIRYALESVASSGTARGAYIEGLRVGGKTGTAQIAENGHYVAGRYILSFLGMMPMNDPQIAIYLAIDSPHNTIQYGGVVCAPIVREILEQAKTILKIEKQSEGLSLNARYGIDTLMIPVPSFINLSVTEAKKKLNNVRIEIIGDGKTVIDQLPGEGEVIASGGTILLYTS